MKALYSRNFKVISVIGPRTYRERALIPDQYLMNAGSDSEVWVYCDALSALEKAEATYTVWSAGCIEDIFHIEISSAEVIKATKAMGDELYRLFYNAAKAKIDALP